MRKRYSAADGATAFALPFFNAEQGWEQAMHAVGAWNEKVGSALAKCQGEYLEFVQRRLQADVSLAQNLARCKSPSDVMSTYTGYWETAANDYRSQIETSAEIATTLAKAGTPILLGNAVER
jgi:hypothetical protein